MKSFAPLLLLLSVNAARIPKRAAAEGPPEIGTEVRGYEYQGCYSDNARFRTLRGASFSEHSMTATSCITKCKNAGFDIAGLEEGTDCYCDNVMSFRGTLIAASECATYTCPGDRKQNCGGDLALAIYTVPEWVSPAAAASSSSAASSLSASISRSSSQSISQSASVASSLSASRSASASAYTASSAAAAASLSASVASSSSLANSISLSRSVSQSLSVSISASASQSLSASQRVSASLSQSQAASQSASLANSLSQSISASQSASASLSQSISASQSASASVASSLAQSISQSVSASQSASASLAASLSQSLSASESASASLASSLSQSQSLSASQSASASLATSLSQSLSASESASASLASSVSLSQSLSASQSASASMAASLSQSVSQSASAAASLSQSISASASLASQSLSASQSLANSISQSLGESISRSASESLSASASLASSLSESISLSQAASAASSLSLSQSLSASLSASASASLASSTSASLSQSASLASSLSQSVSESASAVLASSLSQSQSLSLSQSLSAAISQSMSASASLASSLYLSQSVSEAISASASASAAASLAESVVNSLAASESASASLSASVSQSVANSVAASESASAASFSESLASSIAASETASASVASSLAQSLVASQSASLAASLSVSASASAASLAESVVNSLAASESASLSQSVAASETASASLASFIAASRSVAEASEASSVMASLSASASVFSATSMADASLSASVYEASLASGAEYTLTSAAASASAAAASSTAAVASAAAAAAAATTLPSPWIAAGPDGALLTIAEGTTGRALTGDSTSADDMTFAKCVDYCSNQGFTMAGLEYSSECHCGNMLRNGASLSKTANGDMACSGDSTSMCGGSAAVTLFVNPSSIAKLTPDLNDSLASLPVGWAATGACIAESTSGRALTGGYTASGDMTHTKCLEYCASQGFGLAAIEYSSECFCGHTLSNGAALSVTSSNCNMACSGDSTTICGGPSALSLFITDAAAQDLNVELTALAVAPGPPAGWTGAGSGTCIAESSSGRALTGGYLAASDMTYTKCLDHCKGFALAAIDECFCGDTLVNGAALSITSPDCNMPCSGDNTSICGGPSALTLFVSSDAKLNAELTATPAAPAQPLPTGWTGPTACIAESTSGRALAGAYLAATDMTYQKCLDYCSSQNFALAAIEYASECFCGNTLVNGAALSITSPNCNMACSGDATSMCGGPSALTLFATSDAQLNAELTDLLVTAETVVPDGWTVAASACIAEGPTGRALTGASTSGDMTYSKCLDYCASQGFMLAGIEYANECFCGNALVNGASLSATSSNCNMACSGDATAICGGPSALSLFVTSAGSDKLNSDLTALTTAAAVVLPSGWTGPVSGSPACIAEGTSGRALTGASTATNDMTYDACLNFCAGRGFALAAIEYSGECFCGNSLSNGASLSATSTQCNMPCSGDYSSICGGPDALTLFATTAAISKLTADLTAPLPVSLPDGWAVASTACLAEGTSGHALAQDQLNADDMTPAMCMDYCGGKGYAYSGVEYSKECYCGSSLQNGASLDRPSSACTMVCGGDALQLCGGPGALSLFYNPGLATTPETTATSTQSQPVSSSSEHSLASTTSYASTESATKTTTSPESSPTSSPSPTELSASSSTTSSVAPGPTIKTEGLPGGWSPASTPCIQEVAGRSLDGAATFSSSMTMNQCLEFCGGQGMKYAGVEYGSECFCSHELSNGASLSLSSGQCYMPCSGDPTSLCGGPNAIQLYSNPSIAAPVSKSVNGFTQAGCIQEVDGHALNGTMTASNDMTPDQCSSFCQSGGFKMFGLEYGRECYCGNQLNGPALVSQMCNMPCAGDSNSICGGPSALSIYTSV